MRNLILVAVAAGALFASTGLVLADDANAPTETATTAVTTTTTTTTTAPAPATVAQTNSRDEIVCRTLDAPTGSRFGARKICKTAGQWSDEQAQAQHDLSKQQVQITTTAHGN